MSLNRALAIGTLAEEPRPAFPPNATPNSKIIAELISSGSFSERDVRSLRSFARETDRGIFLDDLFRFAGRKERTDASAASVIYSALSHTEIQARALRRLETFQGQGTFGSQAEHFFRQLPDQVLAFDGLAMMWVGAAVFKTTRLLVFGKLRSCGSSPIAIRGISGFSAYLAEASAFALAGRGLSSLSGRAAERPFFQDWAGSALLLGGLRLAGLSAGRFEMQRQLAMLGGIMVGHGLERTLIRSQPLGEGAFFLESFVAWAHFNLAQRFLAGLVGPSFDPYPVWTRGGREFSFAGGSRRPFSAVLQMASSDPKDVPTVRPPAFSGEREMGRSKGIEESGARSPLAAGALRIVPGESLHVQEIWELSDLVKRDPESFTAALERGNLRVLFPPHYGSETLRSQAPQLAEMLSQNAPVTKGIRGRSVVLEIPEASQERNFKLAIVAGSRGFEIPDPQATRAVRIPNLEELPSPTVATATRPIPLLKVKPPGKRRGYYKRTELGLPPPPEAPRTPHQKVEAPKKSEGFFAKLWRRLGWEK